MGRMFDVKELVKIGIEDETTGVAFYARAAEKAADADLKKVLTDLSSEERAHRKHFEDMLHDMGDYQSPEERAGEYADYLHALTSDRAFPDEAAALRMLDACGDDLATLKLALRFERNARLLMSEMKGLVREKDRAVVEELACEERAHIVVLTEVREKLAG